MGVSPAVRRLPLDQARRIDGNAMAPGTSTDVPRLIPFTLGDWLVEPKACRVSRGDAVVKLRPQLVDVLVCLARQAGEIVLKDEILAEVWPGQYIAESGLSRCVAELRQSLQDDAQEPRFIETIPKRGYRLIAPVVWVEQAERAEAGSVQAPPGPEMAAGAAVAGDLAQASADTRGADRRAVGWRRGMWVAAAVGLLAIAAVAVVLLVRQPASALTERDTVLLADVANTTGDSAFDGTLRLALAIHLGQAPFLHILPQDMVRAAVARTGRSPDARIVGPLALDVCRREGAAVLLAGSIAPLGSRYAVGIEAIACGTGEALGRALVEADSKEHVLTALERAATRIRQQLGESHDSLRQHDVPLVRATTPSLDALKALTQGDFNRDHARVDQALTFYRQATELDPEFALAWARRGAAATNLDYQEEAIPAFRRAYELRDRVSPPERFYIVAHYYRTVAGDPEKAIETYLAWKRMYPGSPVPPTNLASTYTDLMGQYDAAVPEALEAVHLAPYSSLAYTNLGLAYRGSGRIAEARKAVAEAANRGIDDRLMRDELLDLVILDGDPAAIDRENRRASGNPMAELRVLRLRALVAMAGGRLREARQRWSEALAKAGEIGPARRVAETRIQQAEAEALLGDPREAGLAVEAGLAADRGAATLVRSAIVYGLVGDPARAGAILDEVARHAEANPASLRGWLPVARALTAASQGHAADGLEILQPVARFERGAMFSLVPVGVRALVERSARRSSDAAAAFEELIGLRAVVPASPWVAFARLGLARALRESGDTARSLAAYDAFLDSWKNADTDAPLLKAARQERAALAAR